MSRGDRLLIASLAIILLIAWPLGAAAAGQSSRRVTIQGPNGTTSVPLTEDAILQVEGRVGVIDVVVANGTVRVTDAGCPDLVCVRTGPIDAPGSVIACVPNGVLVRVEGRGDRGLDAVVR